MKFSDKGKAKILDNRYWFLEEFNQDDFQEAIVLSIKEAKEILQSSYDVLSWSMVGPTHRDNAVYVQNLLKYRIEQAEASK